MNNYTPHKFNNLEDIDKSLEIYNLPKLNHEKIKNLNRSITIKGD